MMSEPQAIVSRPRLSANFNPLSYATETKPTPRRSVDEVLESGVGNSNQQHKEKYQNKLAKN
jgi:hypothetical protein